MLTSDEAPPVRGVNRDVDNTNCNGVLNVLGDTALLCTTMGISHFAEVDIFNKGNTHRDLPLADIICIRRRPLPVVAVAVGSSLCPIGFGVSILLVMDVLLTSWSGLLD